MSVDWAELDDVDIADLEALTDPYNVGDPAEDAILEHHQDGEA